MLLVPDEWDKKEMKLNWLKESNVYNLDELLTFSEYLIEKGAIETDEKVEVWDITDIIIDEDTVPF